MSRGHDPLGVEAISATSVMVLLQALYVYNYLMSYILYMYIILWIQW